jgi:hypothetical protein
MEDSTSNVRKHSDSEVFLQAAVSPRQFPIEPGLYLTFSAGRITVNNYLHCFDSPDNGAREGGEVCIS